MSTKPPSGATTPESRQTTDQNAALLSPTTYAGGWTPYYKILRRKRVILKIANKTRTREAKVESLQSDTESGPTESPPRGLTASPERRRRTRHDVKTSPKLRDAAIEIHGKT